MILKTRHTIPLFCVCFCSTGAIGKTAGPRAETHSPANLSSPECLPTVAWHTPLVVREPRKPLTLRGWLVIGQFSPHKGADSDLYDRPFSREYGCHSLFIDDIETRHPGIAGPSGPYVDRKQVGGLITAIDLWSVGPFNGGWDMSSIFVSHMIVGIGCVQGSGSGV